MSIEQAKPELNENKPEGVDPLVKHFVGPDGYIGFIATVTKKSETHIDVTVEEVIAWGEGNVPVQTELYCTAYMKWDGCCHVWFGEEEGEGDKKQQDGYLHLCGKHSWKQHIAMMEWLYKLASELIIRFDDSERW